MCRKLITTVSVVHFQHFTRHLSWTSLKNFNNKSLLSENLGMIFWWFWSMFLLFKDPDQPREASARDACLRFALKAEEVIMKNLPPRMIKLCGVQGSPLRLVYIKVDFTWLVKNVKEWEIFYELNIMYFHLSVNKDKLNIWFCWIQINISLFFVIEGRGLCGNAVLHR